MAASTGNIAAIINEIVDAGALTEDDYIEKSIGNLRFFYYTYLDAFHQKPRDLIDLVDGMLFIECKAYVQQREMDKQERKLQEGKT